MSSPQNDALTIFRAALKRVEPQRLIAEHLGLESRDGQEMLVIRVGSRSFFYPLSKYHTIVVTGYGKASPAMAEGLEAILGDRIQGGLVVTKVGNSSSLKRIRVVESAHPVPDASSESAAHQLMDFARVQTAGTLVLNCVSGGGSSLLCAPNFGLTLQDKQKVNQLLLGCGAPITEVNSVRKHLSMVKGGRLAELFYPATVVNLVLSDVMGDQLATVASGPTIHDPSTWSEARLVVRRFYLDGAIPARVLEVLEDGAGGRLPETPKSAHPAFTLCDNILVGCNSEALEAAFEAARSLGYETTILSSNLEGEARKAAGLFVAKVGLSSSSTKRAFLAGGETTVTVTGQGVGGRNQELAVGFAQGVHEAGLDFTRGAFLSGATDGSDGPTDAAGGIVDGKSLGGLASLASAALADNDTYHALEKSGCLLKTGSTGTNVCDIQILLLS